MAFVQRAKYSQEWRRSSKKERMKTSHPESRREFLTGGFWPTNLWLCVFDISCIWSAEHSRNMWGALWEARDTFSRGPQFWWTFTADWKEEANSARIYCTLGSRPRIAPDWVRRWPIKTVGGSSTTDFKINPPPSHSETLADTTPLTAGEAAPWSRTCQQPDADCHWRTDGRTDGRGGKVFFFALRKRWKKKAKTKNKKKPVHSVSGGVAGVGWVGVTTCKKQHPPTALSKPRRLPRMLKALRAEASATPAASGCQGWLKTWEPGVLWFFFLSFFFL